MCRSTRRLLAGTALATVLLGLAAGQASALGTRARPTPATVDQIPPAKVDAGTRPNTRPTPAAKRPAVKPQLTKPRPTKPATAPRRAVRRPAALPTSLQVAQSQVGGPETRYTTEWGFEPGFWCAKFVSWVLAHAGVAVREDGPKDLALLVPPVTAPQPGDLVFVDLLPGNEGSGFTHVGIVEAVGPDGSVRTIEGNTGSSGTVVRSVRRGAEIVGFGRPPPPTSTTVIPAPPAD